jgi:hypothetical protein
MEGIMEAASEKVVCSKCGKRREPEYTDRCAICGEPFCLVCTTRSQVGHVIEIGCCLFDAAAVLRLYVCPSIGCSAEFAGRYPDLAALVERYEDLRGRIDNWINEFDRDNDGLSLAAEIRTRRVVGMTFAETLTEILKGLAVFVSKYPELFGEAKDVSGTDQDGSVAAVAPVSGGPGAGTGETGGDPQLAAPGPGAGRAAAVVAGGPEGVLAGVGAGAESPGPAAGGDPADRLGV